VTFPQCFGCRHYIGRRINGGYQCSAFRDQPIPTQILTNEHDHRDPFPGDHGILFEPDRNRKPISLPIDQSIK
jgi:hypothetical protein